MVEIEINDVASVLNDMASHNKKTGCSHKKVHPAVLFKQSFWQLAR